MVHSGVTQVPNGKLVRLAIFQVLGLAGAVLFDRVGFAMLAPHLAFGSRLELEVCIMPLTQPHYLSFTAASSPSPTLLIPLPYPPSYPPAPLH